MSLSLTSPTRLHTGIFGTPCWSPLRRLSAESTSWTCAKRPCAKIAADFRPFEESMISRFRVLPVLIGLFATVSSAFATNPELSSAGLEQRVDFWKKVYTQYGQDDIIIHDLYLVNLIYDVANDDDVRSKTAAAQATLREIRAGLDTPEAFSPEARTIRDSIAAQGIPLTASLLDDLIRNVHTQRGIKERFREGIIRSGRHVEEFRETLKKLGVPEELA